MCFESLFDTDVGVHVECDDKYWLCYKAEIRCERLVTEGSQKDTQMFYLRGCAREAIFGENVSWFLIILKQVDLTGYDTVKNEFKSLLHYKDNNPLRPR